MCLSQGVNGYTRPLAFVGKTVVSSNEAHKSRRVRLRVELCDYGNRSINVVSRIYERAIYVNHRDDGKICLTKVKEPILEKQPIRIPTYRYRNGYLILINDGPKRLLRLKQVEVSKSYKLNFRKISLNIWKLTNLTYTWRS